MKWIVAFWVGLSWGITFAQKPAPKNPTETNNSTSGVGTVAPTPGQTYALIVGISNYKFVDPLRYADKDAEAFSQYLLSPAGGSVPQANITLLTNEKASLAQIIKALDDLVEVATSRDRVIIFFSGHGDEERISEANRGYLLAYDTFSNYYQFGALRLEDFEQYVKKLSLTNQANVWVFLDACRSGKLIGNSIGGAKITAREMAKTWGKEIKILSCQPDEYSWESNQLQRGIFSYHLIRGLQGLADADRNANVSLQELRRYLEVQVPAEALKINKEQTPDCIGNLKTTLAKAHSSTLLALRANRPLPIFKPIKGIRKIDSLLVHVSDTTRALYSRFERSLGIKDSTKILTVLFDQLLSNKEVKALAPMIERAMIAHVFDQSQISLSEYLSNKLPEINAQEGDYWVNYIPCVCKFIDTTHILIRGYTIHDLFYKALMHKYKKDSLQAIRTFDELLQIDSTLAFVYNEKAFLYQPDKSIPLLKRGLLFAPNWAILYINLAEEYRKKKQLNRAVEYAEKSLYLSPNLPEGLIVKATIYADSNLHESAVQLYEQSIKNKPLFNAFWGKGISLENLKRYEEAIQAYDQAIALKKDNESVYFSKGVSLYNLKRYQEALQAYDQAIALKKDFLEAHNNKGASLANLNRYQEAIQAYDQAIALKKDFLEAHNGKGISLDNLNRFEEAIQAYDQAIALKKDYTEVYYKKGVSLANLKRHEEAIQAYDQAIALKKDYPVAYYNKGISLENLNRFEEAIQAYDQAIALKKDYTEVYYNKGVNLANLKRHEEAIQAYDQVIALKKDNYEAYNNKASSLLSLEQYEASIAISDQAIAIDSTMHTAYFNKAGALLKMGKYQTAIANYSKTLQLKPNFFQALYFQGVAYDSLNKDIEAIASYKKAIEAEPQFFDPYKAIFLLYLDQTPPDTINAEHYLRKALQIDSTNSYALYFMGYLCLRSNRMNEAKQYLLSSLVNSPDNRPTYSFLGTIYLNEKDTLNYIASLENENRIEPSGELMAKIARMSLQIKDWEKAINYLKKIRQYDKNNYYLLLDLASAYYYQGKYADALLYFEMASTSKPQEALPYYWLAKGNAQSGQSLLFYSNLERALEQGYNDWAALELEPAWANFKQTAEFEALINKYKK